MRAMNKFKKYKKGTITIEIQSLMPERFINLLWKNDVKVQNVKKTSITTMIMDLPLKDYDVLEECAKKTQTKIKILKRKGLSFFWLMMKRRIALFAGIVIFGGLLYYLSTFIWKIDIVTDQVLTPYEIRQQLASYGIKPGINKSNVNVYEIQDKMLKNNENIMWIKVRIEGSELKVNVVQRLSPPDIITDDTPCNLLAKRDGEIVSIYTTAGTAVVRKGQIVKKGQILVKGEQGKEGAVYQVHAKGEVKARTYYEAEKEVEISGVKEKKTGKSIKNIYVEVKGKKIYLKNSLNKFSKYDKIVNNKQFFKTEIYNELKEEKFQLDSKKVIDDTSKELYDKITARLDKSIKIVDKKLDTEIRDNKCFVRLIVIAEENIALPEKIQ